jgi:NADH-quinone oxidoreductase subunit L
MMLSFDQDALLRFALLSVLPPFCSFGLIMGFLRSCPRLSSLVSITAVAMSLCGAVLLLLGFRQPVQYSATWIVTGDLSLAFGFLLDPTSLLMLVLVAGISFLVQAYSVGYMAGDSGYSRYFAFQSLFAWAMMFLVLSSSLLQLYVFWELVGLSSYLLIGFWYEKFSASQAGKKAFVMTRVGDVALFMGILLILIHTGGVSIQGLNGSEITSRISPDLLTLSALLIFGGIIGKSAQFPLLTWLPDAMEGPTPVSALLHSATMVAAGVYLMARLFPFLSHAEAAMTVFLVIGTITMLMASTMAMVEKDLKRIWAYSTISQLGFMIMGLGAGGFFEGTFHLTTHAVFKALLFLCSGVWIHLYGTNDIFAIGRHGARRLKAPMICIFLAAASLSGIAPFSGFFSKEAVMGVLAGLDNPVWVTAGFLGVFLTAYYAFRALFVILFPREEGKAGLDENKGKRSNGFEKEHDPALYWTMTWPLILLSCFTVLLGFFEPVLKVFLLGDGSMRTTPHPWVLWASSGLALLGVVLAWFEFGRKGSARTGFAERIAPIRDLFTKRWYLDHAYELVLEYVVYRTFAALCSRNDRQVIDGGIDGLSSLTVLGGRILSALQSGALRYNVALPFVMVALVVFCMLVI